MRLNAMNRLRLVLALASLFTLGAAPVVPSSTDCAFGPATRPGEACAPFTIVPVRLRSSLSQSADEIATLSDGSLVVQTFRALYRIHEDTISPLWDGRTRLPRPQVFYWKAGSTPPPRMPTPAPYFGDVELLGAFDDTAVFQFGSDWIYGVGSDGTVKLRFYLAGSDMSDRPTFAGRDRDGTLWFKAISKRSNRDTAYALYPNGTLSALPTTVGIAFQGSTGSVYATNDSALFELRSIPYVHARLVVTWDRLRFGNMNSLRRHQVGADGSLWSSSATSVVHRHLDGRFDEIRLRGPFMTISHIPIPFDIRSSSDGSVWLASPTKLVRITSDDRIEVMNVPDLGASELRTASDGSVWLRTVGQSGTVIRHYSAPTN
jgi:hypothetical protein